MRRTRWDRLWLVMLLAAMLVVAAGCVDINVGPDNGDDDDDDARLPADDGVRVAGVWVSPREGGACTPR